MIKFIQSMLSGKGPISTTRVVTVATAFTVLGVYIAQNVMAMIKCGGYADFPTNSVMALLVVMGAKVGQSVFENKTPTIPEIPTESPENKGN
jgi:uncharacterized membrane protein